MRGFCAWDRQICNAGCLTQPGSSPARRHRRGARPMAGEPRPSRCTMRSRGLRGRTPRSSRPTPLPSLSATRRTTMRSGQPAPTSLPPAVDLSPSAEDRRVPQGRLCTLRSALRSVFRAATAAFLLRWRCTRFPLCRFLLMLPTTFSSSTVQGHIGGCSRQATQRPRTDVRGCP